MALVKMTVNGQAVEHDVPDNTCWFHLSEKRWDLRNPCWL